MENLHRIQNRKIKKIVLNTDKDELDIFFDEMPHLFLTLCPDCSDENIFVFPDIKYDDPNLVGKIFSDIRVNEEFAKPKTIDRGYYEVDNQIIIKFHDNSEFAFIWRHTCNGYYNGTLDIHIGNSKCS